MKIIWLWITGGWKYFKPAHCIDCGEWTLVFKANTGDEGRCEECWLGMK